MLTTVAEGRVYDWSHSVGRGAAAGDGFNQPCSIAAAPQGVMYVVSRGNENNFGSRVSKVFVGDPGDEKVQAEFCRYGTDPGRALWPNSVALDKQGNVYVSDDWLNRISVFDPDGNFLSAWGSAGSGQGQLDGPAGLAFDTDNNLYVVDSRNHRLQVFTSDGRYLGGCGKLGTGPVEFNMPWGIHIDANNDVFVADWKNNRVQKLTTSGGFLMEIAGEGARALNHPTHMTTDAEGDIYVCDWANHKLRIYTPEGDLITSLVGDAQVMSKWGQQSLDANPDMVKMRRRVKSLEREWRFCYPTAVAYDFERETVLVADCQRGRLQIYKKDKNYLAPQFNL
ncbi:MAG: NHL repeat-containing protein [Chloroflexota bacterium]